MINPDSNRNEATKNTMKNGHLFQIIRTEF